MIDPHEYVGTFQSSLWSSGSSGFLWKSFPLQDSCLLQLNLSLRQLWCCQYIAIVLIKPWGSPFTHWAELWIKSKGHNVLGIEIFHIDVTSDKILTAFGVVLLTELQKRSDFSLVHKSWWLLTTTTLFWGKKGNGISAKLKMSHYVAV